MSEKAEHPVIEFVHEELESRFTVPERPTVRQQLRYKGEIGLAQGADQFIKLWEGAKYIIEDFDSPHLALDDDLDEIHSPNATQVIRWAGLQVWGHVFGLEEIDPN